MPRESIEADLAALRKRIASAEEWAADDPDDWAARITLAGLRSRESRLMAELSCDGLNAQPAGGTIVPDSDTISDKSK